MFFINTLECLLLLALGAFFFIECLYYGCLYGRLHRQHKKEAGDGLAEGAVAYPPLSVIVAAKDMGASLQRNLPRLLEQDYPQFEVIVVNDGSTDDTEEILKLMERKYSHLYHTFTPQDTRYVSRKKLSLTLGVRASKYDWLVFTEASCYPVSNGWLKSLARRFTPETQLVLGYGNYEEAKGWSSLKMRFDRLWQALQYLSAAACGFPYAGSGVNMAYRKELFYDHKGFSAHLSLKRGEDDLFINQVASGKNTRVAFEADAVVRMEAPESTKCWADEKVEHCATARCYKGLGKVLVGCEPVVRLLFLAECVALWAHAVYYQHWLVGVIALLLWLLRMGFQWMTFAFLAKDLNERTFRVSLLLFDVLQPLWDLRYWLRWKLHDPSEFRRDIGC